jgi:hypothetical protein
MLGKAKKGEDVMSKSSRFRAMLGGLPAKFVGGLPRIKHFNRLVVLTGQQKASKELKRVKILHSNIVGRKP